MNIGYRRSVFRFVVLLGFIFHFIFLAAGYGEENTGTVQQPLVNGETVSPVFQETYGLLSLGNCSATLLTNDWAITAAHCFDPAKIANPSTVTITANWTTPSQRKGAQIETFSPWDVALIRMDYRFVLAGSDDGFQQLVWLDGPYNPNLLSTRIELLGRGIYQFASGSGSGATPSQRDGKYRYGTAFVTRFDGNLFWYTGDNGVMIAGGDSGGASYARVFGGRAITGVHSLCHAKCMPGKMCGPADPWSWVTETIECADAPIQPIWNEIVRTIETTRSPSLPTDPLGPNNPSGTFDDYKSCDPIVFIPAPDVPAQRINGTWGDRGFWDEDRINVRIQESPQGSGMFDVIVREANSPNAIEVSAQQVSMSDAATFQYDQAVYAVTIATVPDSAKTNVGTLGGAIYGRPAPSREPGGALGGSRLDGPAISQLDPSIGSKLTVRFDRSLGLSIGNGIRLEIDIQCDERLSPRIYQVRYLRFGDSGEKIVDVMLNPSQPRAR